MITKSDLNISNLSYCSKDFYQLYPEAKEFIHNLTNVIDLDNTNESDPIVVIVKLACFIADKLNYNIDKNILEAFITSATQEDSFRKLCDMLGYNIKYYNSAETTVSIIWTGTELGDSSLNASNNYIILKPFETVLTNESKDISYVLIGNGALLQYRYTPVQVPAIEGELVTFEVNSNNIILPNNIDDNNRLYLPETMVAENGIWITDANDSTLEWERKENLNTQLKGSRVWKFGYDSMKQTPYIEFPSDYRSLMQEGLSIKYVRTSGSNGNIKAGVLTKLMNNSVQYYKNNTLDDSTELDIENNLVIKNLYATNNGTDIETLDEAYNGFKKTVGTFDTLVTCRDYANAIYQMVMDEKTDNTPLVSNCQVSDIRDELNYSTTVASYSSLGVTYIDYPVQDYVNGMIKTAPDATSQEGWYLADKITNYDLFLYPLRPIKNKYNEATFNQSFLPLSNDTNLNYVTILSNLEDYKTISHVMNKVENSSDLYLIKVYYNLNGKIITNNKVNKFEQAQIKANIYDALYKNFNARMLEYGEEIPYESLVDVIQNSDSRIRAVLLDEPDLSTFYMTLNESEKALKYNSVPAADNSVYFNYVAKNVLGGKVPLFNYNTQVQPTFTESNSSDDKIYGGENNYAQNLGTTDVNNKNSITYISTNYRITGCDSITTGSPLTLGENESIQLVSSKLITEVTYPMYVNFNATLNSGNKIIANKPYLLQSDETLYINYTDTDKGELWIRYYKGDNSYIKETYKTGGGTPTTETFSGIIQANFTFPFDSTVSYSKRYDSQTWPSTWNSLSNSGLYSLKTSQEISIMKNNLSRIQQKAFIYWLANNNNTLTFNKIATGTYECILNDGEYFFYTNEAKTDLLTLGPGTRLTYYPSSIEINPLDDSTILWALNDSESITKDDVAENGIGAFAQNDWIVKNWNSSNYLETEQMETLNLTEGDKITKLELSPSTVTTIDSTKWYDLTKLEYNNTTIESISGVKTWKVRSVLNLNLGPQENQTLKTGQSITLYTSWYADKTKNLSTPLSDSEIVNLLQQDPSRLIEHIETAHPIKLFNNKETLKANLVVKKSGGLYVSTHTSGITGSIKDNLLIYPVITTEAKDGNNQEVNLNNPITVSELVNAGKKYISLPVYIPEKNFNLISIYYDAQSGQYINIDLVDKNGTSLLSTASLKEWKTGTAIGALTDIGSGLHIFRISGISSEAYLKIKAKENSNVGGTIKILSSKLVDCEDEMNETSCAISSAVGLNYKLLGIPASASSTFLTSTKIQGSNAKYDFYATLDIDNSMLMDVSDLSDPYTFFNYNNAVNKFVLAQLNTKTFENIEIASSSKL